MAKGATISIPSSATCIIAESRHPENGRVEQWYQLPLLPPRHQNPSNAARNSGSVAAVIATASALRNKPVPSLYVRCASHLRRSQLTLLAGFEQFVVWMVVLWSVFDEARFLKYVSCPAETPVRGREQEKPR